MVVDCRLLTVNCKLVDCRLLLLILTSELVPVPVLLGAAALLSCVAELGYFQYLIYPIDIDIEAPRVQQLTARSIFTVQDSQTEKSRA